MLEIINNPQWDEVENKIYRLMDKILMDLPMSMDKDTVAIHALANYKAYKLLEDLLYEANLLKKDKSATGFKRDFN